MTWDSIFLYGQLGASLRITWDGSLMLAHSEQVGNSRTSLSWHWRSQTVGNVMDTYVNQGCFPLHPLPPEYSLQGCWLVLPSPLGEKGEGICSQRVRTGCHRECECIWVTQGLSAETMNAPQIASAFLASPLCSSSVDILATAAAASPTPPLSCPPKVRAGSRTPSHACHGGSHEHPGTQSHCTGLIKASIPPILSGLQWSAGLWNVAASGDRTWRCQGVHVPWTNSDQGCGQQINSSTIPPRWTFPVWWSGQSVQRHSLVWAATCALVDHGQLSNELLCIDLPLPDLPSLSQGFHHQRISL